MRVFQNLFVIVFLLLGFIPAVSLFAADQVQPVTSDPAEINTLVTALGDFVKQNPSIFSPHPLNEDEKQVLKAAIEQGTRLLEKTPSAEQKYWAADFLLKARLALAREQSPSSMTELRTIEELVVILEEKPEKVEILPMAKYQILKYSVLLLTKQGNDLPDPYQVKEAVKQYIAENPRFLDTFGRVLVEVAVLYAVQDRQFTIETLKDVAELYQNSGFRDDMFYAGKLLDMSKRFEMIGKPITFSGVDLAGKKISSTDFKNKVILIDFWGTWCPTCVMTIPEMKRLYETYNKQGFEIVGVNVAKSGVSVDKNKEVLVRFLEEKKLPWTTLSDATTEEKGGMRLTRYFGVSEYPTLMLIGRDGKLIATDFDLKTLEKELIKQFNNKNNSQRPKPGLIPSVENPKPVTPSLL